MRRHAVHRSHPAIVKRLRRAEGHLRKTIEMIEEERACVDIAQQLQAVESAVASAKRTLIHDHIDRCLEQTAARGTHARRGPVEEFKRISKFL